MVRGAGALACLLLLFGCGGGASAPISTVALPTSDPAPSDPPADDPPAPVVAPVRFEDATAAAGLLDTDPYEDVDYRDKLLDGRTLGGGACAGDFDGDGWVDLYVIRGLSGPNRLYRNLGDGTFEDVAASAGVDLDASGCSGPIFADYDGDGLLDLFVGGVDGAPSTLFRNRGDGTFQDVTLASGLTPSRKNTLSAAFADYDRDGDLDVVLSHWEIRSPVVGSPELLWRNKGDGTFEDASDDAGLTDLYDGLYDYSFTPNFADVNGDGWPDLLLASDFETSRVLLNQQDGSFIEATTPVISDKNGMGASVADYDNDGDLDWFVTAIFRVGRHAETGEDPRTLHGNRLYRNRGDGTFEDVTSESGVRVGHWGWAGSFADFNNDGWLDIAHCNGWVGTPEYERDPSILFLSQGDGSFEEVAEASGFREEGQGRGLVCFDFDRDGDVDLFQANLNESGRLYRNDTVADHHHLQVRLAGRAPNTQAVGARIYAKAAGRTSLCELRCGSNYVSSDPVRAHFGLGSATLVDELRVVWPDGSETRLEAVVADQVLVLHQDAR